MSGSDPSLPGLPQSPPSPPVLVRMEPAQANGEPEAPRIQDDDYVFDVILDPLLRILPLASWEGVTLGMLDSYSIPDEVLVSYRHRGRVCLLASIMRADEGSAQATRRIWDGFMAWYLWVLSRSPTKLAIPSWFFLGTYPGTRFQIPREWVKAAEGEGITWGEWRAATQAIHETGLPPTRNGLLGAVRRARALRGVETRQTRQRALLAEAGLGLPDDWAQALDLLESGRTKTTAATYRSNTLRVIREASEGLSPDRQRCQDYAEDQGGPLRTAWRAFASVLDTMRSTGAQASTRRPVLNLDRGPIAPRHLTCVAAADFVRRVEDDLRAARQVSDPAPPTLPDED